MVALQTRSSSHTCLATMGCRIQAPDHDDDYDDVDFRLPAQLRTSLWPFSQLGDIDIDDFDCEDGINDDLDDHGDYDDYDAGCSHN